MSFKYNIQAWEAVVITAHTGNISQTARLMNADVPRVSRWISGLEKELGGPLFDRTRRPFPPTVKCLELVLEAEPLVRGFRQMFEEHAVGAAPRRVLRFAAPIELEQEYFSKLLYDYSEAHPHVEFQVFPEVPVEAVLSGEVDVAVVNERPETGAVGAGNLVARAYNTSTTPVLASPEYLARHGTPRTPEDLVEHTGLLFQTINRKPSQFLFRDGVPSTLLKWKRTFATHDQFTLKELVLGGRGITTDLYCGHVIKEIESGALVPILKGWERQVWTMCVITRADKDMSDVEIRCFAQWLAQTAAREMPQRASEARRMVNAAFERAAAREQ
ncbi:MAG: LysR family transcriptional regulator [Duodenibacillus sp.]|nr:LysR family transcriptional regulator [Duodenibacillus sp.]